MIETYHDPARSVGDRVEDLLARMTLAEKAGLMFQPMVAMGPGGRLAEANEAFGLPSTQHLVADLFLNHFNLLGSVDDPRQVAEWHNGLQEAARQTRLGIPVSLSTDPRHHFTENVGTAFRATAFSQWPETLGFAALRSPELVQEFADIARQEYTAVGFRVALHPQVDLATEPRWARVSGTFGEDADLSGELVAAYVKGFQGDELGPGSVSTMTKHFPGGGPQLDGEDPHFAYGREQVYPGGNFDHHLRPFEAALAAGTSQVMPYYGMPVGTEYEEVGFAFNKGVITGILRERLGFDGIVCTDWGLVTDAEIMGQPMPARAWGCEQLSELERVVKIIEAGCDQFGGESRPELVIEAVEKGLVTVDRIDVSVRRLLREKFRLGLFDNPFVDVDAVAGVVGRQDFVARGEDVQRRSVTVLTNKEHILPLRKGIRLYVEGVDAEVVAPYATVVDSPADADVAFLRLGTPFEPRPGGFEAMFHAGSLEFDDVEKARQAAVYAAVPTVVDIHLERAAVIPEIADQAAAVVATYGTNARALLDVLFGDARPEGRLPFDLPSSMRAVEGSRSDVAFDTAEPLFRFGHGLSL
ncbi:glycoside hydrolase family 3 protein [Actinopolymorpha singaporensis]|uniref:beta-glucosidase n=1 Tax=Actinopolymorpha singaporensis TaxID=117157 RepID=A0A1H1R1V9_9ACTN|nr:glycoside hydrolase family 3 N-terminal domain-containing protein [Actinopolymorpha singaporensis]SDS29728.1 beta-glucosidase [Actinopolymorpha singaporensis]